MSVVSNMVEIGAGQVSERLHCIGDRKKTKHVLAPFDRNPGVISPKNNYAGANNVPHLYSRFHPNPFRFGGVITKRTLPQPPK